MAGQIKSKERVADHGEVFTNEREVNAMLDMVKPETERVESRFLEPACGNGNFLAEVLRRKLEVVDRKYKKLPADWEKFSIVALSSLYGVDILSDNVEECQERLFEIWNKSYQSACKKEATDLCRDAARDILAHNILCGNALDMCKRVPFECRMDERDISKVAKRHYRGIQKLMDELDDSLNEKKRQKIIEEADRKLDNLLQEHKQTAFAEKIMESAESDEKKIPLKKNIIHNIEMVVADYTSDRIAAAVDRVLISTDETDEKVLTRVVMKLLTDSEKETPTKKKKSKKNLCKHLTW